MGVTKSSAQWRTGRRGSLEVDLPKMTSEGEVLRRPGPWRLALALLLAALPAAAQETERMPVHAPQMAAPRAALPDASAGTLVARWVLVTDRLSLGVANPQVMAAVTMAVHDSLNSADPRYRRWGSDATPAAGRGAAEVALSMAAFQVLAAAFPVPWLRAEAEPLLLEVLRAASPAAQQAGLALGQAVGVAAGERLHAPPRIAPFSVGLDAGRWRPTPPFLRHGTVAEAAPVLVPLRDGLRDGLRGAPPPPPGSPRYLADLEEVRRLGARDSAARTAAQTETAGFWAGQSSQRGFLHLALRLLRETPPAGGAWDEARVLSALAVALADAATIAWAEKERHGHWRPITAIREGGAGVVPDTAWEPLLPTPPHPDYPSGHAADCGAGAAVVAAVFGSDREVLYVAMEPLNQPMRRFAGAAAAAEECAESRVLAGAHFRFANKEGLRLGRELAALALAHVSPLARR